MSGLLLVVTGFPGSGKDTAVEYILSQKKLNFSRIITHNTRPRRKGEKHGREYFFVSEHRFKSLIKSGDMIEHVEHGYCLKGTTKDQFERVIKGENLIWRIEPSRAAFAEEFFLEKYSPKTGAKIISNMVKVFISVSDTSILLERYKSREKDSYNIAEFEKRLEQDLTVFNNNMHRFPHIINNDKVGERQFKKMIDLIGKKLVE